MSEHTPGPWRIEPGDSVLVVYHDGLRIASVGSNPYWKRFAESDAANARLIAAAPELLDLAHEVLATATIETPKSLIEKATAAIAKAEGRE